MNSKKNSKLAYIEYISCARIFKYISHSIFGTKLKNKWDYPRLRNDKIGILKNFK